MICTIHLNLSHAWAAWVAGRPIDTNVRNKGSRSAKIDQAVWESKSGIPETREISAFSHDVHAMYLTWDDRAINLRAGVNRRKCHVHARASAAHFIWSYLHLDRARGLRPINYRRSIMHASRTLGNELSGPRTYGAACELRAAPIRRYQDLSNTLPVGLARRISSR